jgi:hypothetical protein
MWYHWYQIMGLVPKMMFFVAHFGTTGIKKWHHWCQRCKIHALVLLPYGSDVAAGTRNSPPHYVLCIFSAGTTGTFFLL